MLNKIMKKWLKNVKMVHDNLKATISRSEKVIMWVFL